MSYGKEYAARRIQGDRDYQEDDFGFLSTLDAELLENRRLIAVLADGMGGHSGGAQASATAVKVFLDRFRDPKGFGSRLLSQALEEANEAIGEMSAKNPDLDGMGCTLLGVVVSPRGLEWISVGDSPLWLYRRGKLTRLNEDHSMAPVLRDLAERGKISEDDLPAHPDRNRLRSAVTGNDLSLIDLPLNPFWLEKGDRIILASDGVETLSEAEIAAVLAETAKEDAETAAQSLITAVESRGRPGQDNATVVVLTPENLPEKEGTSAMVWVLGAALAGVLTGLWLLLS